MPEDSGVWGLGGTSRGGSRDRGAVCSCEWSVLVGTCRAGRMVELHRGPAWAEGEMSDEEELCDGRLCGNRFGDSVMSSPITSLKLAERLTTVLEGWVVSGNEVQAARRIVKSLQSRYQRGRAGGSCPGRC